MSKDLSLNCRNMVLGNMFGDGDVNITNSDPGSAILINGSNPGGGGSEVFSSLKVVNLAVPADEIVLTPDSLEITAGLNTLTLEANKIENLNINAEMTFANIDFVRRITQLYTTYSPAVQPEIGNFNLGQNIKLFDSNTSMRIFEFGVDTGTTTSLGLLNLGYVNPIGGADIVCAPYFDMVINYATDLSGSPGYFPAGGSVGNNGWKNFKTQSSFLFTNPGDGNAPPLEFKVLPTSYSYNQSTSNVTTGSQYLFPLVQFYNVEGTLNSKGDVYLTNPLVGGVPNAYSGTGSLNYLFIMISAKVGAYGSMW